MALTYCHRCDQVKPRGHRHRTKDRRPSARERGYDRQHEVERRRYLATHATCEARLPGCSYRATVLDHKDGMGPNGPFGHDESNWQALCANCHGRKTAEQTPGGINRKG